MKREQSNKFKRDSSSFLLSALYILVLLITSFHHHPENLVESSNTILESNNETTSLFYSSKECPIVVFSKTGFNSSNINNISVENSFRKNIIYFQAPQTFYSKNFRSYFPPRGPPKIKIV